MNQAKEPEREPQRQEQGEHLSRMSQASIHITETLDLDTVLQGVVDGFLSLAGARRGCITVQDDEGRFQRFIISGVTPEERRFVLELPGGMSAFERLSNLPEPLRLADFSGYAIVKVVGYYRHT